MNGTINATMISPFKCASVAVDATSYRQSKRACPLKASLTLKIPPRAQSINVARLKTLAEIVAQPEQDRFELHDQIDARVSSIDRRLEYLIRHRFIERPDVKEQYHDRYEYEASDKGVHLIRAGRKIVPLPS